MSSKYVKADVAKDFFVIKLKFEKEVEITADNKGPFLKKVRGSKKKNHT